MDYKGLYYDILLKKYSVLKKNLIIIEQTEEKINEFKNTIKEIDEIEQEKFKLDIKDKSELTTNLEDEYKRLYDYINLVEERNRKRNNMLQDYSNLVKDSSSIELEEIVEYNNLDFSIKRLDDISNYLNNDEKYNKLQEELNNYLKILDEYSEKQEFLKKKIEDIELNILIKLKEVISNDSIYCKLDYDNLEDNIDNYSTELINKEKELTTYINSYNALLSTMISEEKSLEYKKFIEEEKKEYLELLEKKYILEIYKYINENNIEKAMSSYEERKEKITMYDLIDNSNIHLVFSIIKDFIQKEEKLNDILSSIESINNNIEELNKKKDDAVNELNKINIINLLKEFCIEKEYIDNNKNVLFEENKEDIKNIKEDEDKLLEKTENNLEKEINDDNLLSYEDIVLVDGEVNNNSKEENNKLDVQIDNVKDNSNNYEIIKQEDNQRKENDNLDNNIEIEDKQDNFEIIDEKKLVLEDKNTEMTQKENLIIDIKDISLEFEIDKVRNRALKIMKSVCQSIIKI